MIGPVVGDFVTLSRHEGVPRPPTDAQRRARADPEDPNARIAAEREAARCDTRPKPGLGAWEVVGVKPGPFNTGEDYSACGIHAVAINWEYRVRNEHGKYHHEFKKNRLDRNRKRPRRDRGRRRHGR